VTTDTGTIADTAPPSPLRRLEVAPAAQGVAYVAAALSVGTLVLLLAPSVPFVAVSPAADVALNTTAVLVVGAVAALAWTRYTQRGRWSDLLEAAGFLVPAVVGVLALLALMTGVDSRVGLRLDQPGSAPPYVWMLGRSTAGVALILAAFLAGRTAGISIRTAVLVGVLPAFVVALLAMGIVAVQDSLPPVIGDAGFEQLRSNPVVFSVLPGMTPLGVLLQLAVAGVFLFAAALYTGPTPNAATRLGARPYLAIALVFAAFGHVHAAIYPGTYAGLITTGDILRLTFYVFLLVGLQREAAADMRAVRAANRELERLGAGEAARAAADERARLAREVHDGLVQDLWFAKLKIGLLLERAKLAPAERQLVDDAASALETGLTDARQAVMTLRTTNDGRSLEDVLTDYVEEFAERTGLQAEFVAQGRLPILAIPIQAQLLRMAQEALNNVAKHADATVVKVVASAVEGGYRLSVSDNGRGFEPKATGGDGFGLRTMRERARSMGAELTIESEPRNGTTMSVTMPATPGPR
jgi:signal transduction histidine kinase